MAQDPYAKAVGDIGEQIVDDYYTKILGFQRESSPDYRVDRKYSTPKTKNTVYVEIIARRITTTQIVPAFYIDKDKVERLKNFQEDYGTVTLAIVINPDERRKFKVGLTSLDNLLKSVVIDNIAFPITAEHKVNAGEPPKTVVYFPIEKLTFTHRSVDPALESKLNKAFDEMDAARAGKANSTDGTLFEETPIDEITQKNAPVRIKLSGTKTYYRIPTDSQFPLKMVLYDKKWLVKASSIVQNIAGTSSNFSLYRKKGLGCLEQVVLAECKELYDSSSEESSKEVTYIKYEDVERVLSKVSGLYRKDEQRWKAKKLLEFYREKVLPHIQNDSMRQFYHNRTTPPLTATPPSIEQPPKPKATIIQQILSRATQFKGYGLNGTSLVTAIKFVADDEKFDPQPYLDFMNFAQAEVTHTESTNTK